jgi:glycosyltransferase involved in cell wall biosynthesis
MNPPGLPPALSPERRKALRREFGLADQDIAVAMPCDWVSEQRPEDFLALAQHLRDHPRFSFFLIGRGPLGTALAELQRFFALPKLRLLSDVGELHGTLAAMDIVCSTAAEHSYPYGLATALALGLPVIACGREAASLAAEKCCLAIEMAGDIVAFSDALEHLADDGQRHAYGARAAEFAAEARRGLQGEGGKAEGPLATYRRLLQLKISPGTR